MSWFRRFQRRFRRRPSSNSSIASFGPEFGPKQLSVSTLATEYLASDDLRCQLLEIERFINERVDRMRCNSRYVTPDESVVSFYEAEEQYPAHPSDATDACSVNSAPPEEYRAANDDDVNRGVTDSDDLEMDEADGELRSPEVRRLSYYINYGGSRMYD
ncbi:hypothetical protein ABW20_dc0102351 [Dactylellina cionopaga]|nr:hypothetical protein ABW20_dc0102351 [Dactylellina cionopaga]